jgi:hypothetical protein
LEHQEQDVASLHIHLIRLFVVFHYACPAPSFRRSPGHGPEAVVINGAVFSAPERLFLKLMLQVGALRAPADARRSYRLAPGRTDRPRQARLTEARAGL